MPKEAKILLGIGIAVVLGGIALFAFQGKPEKAGQPVDTNSLIRETSRMTGSKDAKVTLVEFGDYECPACGMAHPILKRIIEDYGSNPDFNFVFRNFPLRNIHPNAMISAQAAEAAGAQRKFWEMHDLLYEKQEEWTKSSSPLDLFMTYAGQLGLDANKLKSDIEQNIHRELVLTDLDDGGKIGVNSTPTIFINGEETPGFQYELLKNKIEEKLK
jgi:protein-disulfide isomerase